MAYCIGLTGNIASGKSTVAGFFSELGIEVISADAIARELTTPKQHAFQAIVSHFGAQFLTPDGQLNRLMLRKQILMDQASRLWLENLLHPLIRREIENRIQKVKSPYCIIEIPLLFSRASYPYLNQVLMVQSQRELQIERCMTRDGGTKEEIRAILELQSYDKQHLMPEEILKNNGSLAELKEKVGLLHLKYLACTTALN